MGNELAIMYFLKSERFKDEDKWFSIKDISNSIRLSRDRVGKHLRNLTVKRLVETKIDGWSNVYRYRR